MKYSKFKTHFLFVGVTFIFFCNLITVKGQKPIEASMIDIVKSILRLEKNNIQTTTKVFKQ